MSTFQNKKPQAKKNIADVTNLVVVGKKANVSWFKRFKIAIGLEKGEFGVGKNKGGYNSSEFVERYNEVMAQPDLWKNQLWVVLEMPNNSRLGRGISYFLATCIIITVFILYTQTMQSLTKYGEGEELCKMLAGQYCADKDDLALDPGCFAHDENTLPIMRNQKFVKARFGCNEDDCFGFGYNFGSPYTNITCLNSTKPFQSQNSLIYHYGKPLFFTNRVDMQSSNPVCTRLECQFNNQIGDGPKLWIAWEFFSTFFFSVEIFLRILISKSIMSYLRDKMNIFDILSIFPFYVECINNFALKGLGLYDLNFGILPSSPEPVVLVFLRSFKIFRLFKLARNFNSSKVLAETASKAWRQIVSIISLLLFTVVVFSILLFEVEAGRSCFVGEKDCLENVPEGTADMYHIGDRLVLNKNDGISSFSNVFFGFWFSFVTLTTTGYGDYTPVTNIGQIMAIFIMLAGAFYMAMPLTAAASVFFKAHTDHLRNLETLDHLESHMLKAMQEDNNEDKQQVLIIDVKSQLQGANQRVTKAAIFPRAMRFEDELNQLNLQIIDFLNSLKEDSSGQEDDQNESSSFINKSRDTTNDSSKLMIRYISIVNRADEILLSEQDLVKALSIESSKSQLDLIQRTLLEQKRKSKE